MLGEHNEVGGIADESPEVSSRAHADVRQAIAWARELGTDVVLIPFFMRAELVNDADDDRAVAAFQALCPQAAEQGVTLCFEGSLPAAADRVARVPRGLGRVRLLLRSRQPARPQGARLPDGDSRARLG